MLKPKNFGDYVLNFPPEIQKRLMQIRATIKKAAPGAEEVISYGMPAFKMNGILVYFAAWLNHIGFYPGSSGIEKFNKELSVYKGAKGSVQFPNDEPLPVELITKMVKYRVQRNLENTKKKKNL